MQKQFKQYQYLADQPDLQVYTHNPIQNYGMSLLKGMGFDQKKGLGKNRNQKPTEVLVLKPRPKGLGLGAELGEEETKDKIQIGDRVKILDGSHKDLCGCVSEVMDQNNANIELLPSKAKVKILIQNIHKISKKQMDDFLNQISKGGQKKKKRLKWILPHIRVKVIDRNSDLYLQKVIVTEILNDRQFECRDETGKVHSNLVEKDVQTVVPKVGIVMILKGIHKGQKAKVLEKKKGKNKVTLQTEVELEILKMQQDDVAQYIQL